MSKINSILHYPHPSLVCTNYIVSSLSILSSTAEGLLCLPSHLLCVCVLVGDWVSESVQWMSEWGITENISPVYLNWTGRDNKNVVYPSIENVIR